MASALLPFGVLRRPHGLKGEIFLHPYGDAQDRSGQACLPPRLFVAGADGPRETAVASARAVREGYLVRFQGIGDRDAAATLVGKEVSVERESLGPLGPAEFLVDDLVGCEVLRDGGGRLGKIMGTYWNGAQDVMVITADDGDEHLLPVLPEYVLRFDREHHVLVVDPHD